MNFSVTFEPNLSKEDEETIFGGLLAHGSLETGLPVQEIRSWRFAFVVRTEGKIRAGLICTVFYQTVLMDTLWVEQSLRRNGIGRKLLDEAEAFAKTKGCTTAFLNTLSSDNINFYKKSGYVFEFARPRYLGDFTMHYFRKEL